MKIQVVIRKIMITGNSNIKRQLTYKKIICLLKTMMTGIKIE